MGATCFRNFCHERHSDGESGRLLLDAPLSCRDAISRVQTMRGACTIANADLSSPQLRLGTVIVSGLEALLFRREPLSAEVVEAMREMDSRLLAHSPEASTASPVVNRTLALIEEIIESAIIGISTIARVNTELGPVANLYFDLVSVLGERGQFRFTGTLARIARSGEPRYRPRYSGEQVQAAETAEPISAQWVVATDESIRYCAETTGLLSMARAQPLISLLTNMMDGMAAHQSVAVMLESALLTSLCPVLRRFVALLIHAFPRHLLRRDPTQLFAVLAQLALVCRAQYFDQVVSANRLMDMIVWRHSLSLPIELSDDVSAVAFLTEDLADWMGNIVGDRGSAERLMYRFIAEAGLLVQDARGDTLLPSRASLGEHFEVLLRAYGRAAGILSRVNEKSLSMLHLSPSIVRNLHRVPDKELHVPEQMRESIFYFSKGAADVIGPLAWDVFAPSHLLMIFGISESL